MNFTGYTIQTRIMYNVASLCFKGYRIGSPIYQSSLQGQYTMTHMLRSLSQDMLTLPRSCPKIVTCLFSLYASRLRNSLRAVQAALRVWNSILATVWAAPQVWNSLLASLGSPRVWNNLLATYSLSCTSCVEQPSGYSLSCTSCVEQPSGYNPSFTSGVEQPSGYSPSCTSCVEQPSGYNPSCTSDVE